MNPFIELILILVRLYVSIVLLRFFLQYFRADFYNPISQFIVKASDPLLKPLRKIIPGFGGLDWASLLLAWLILFIFYSVLTKMIMVGDFSIAQLIIYPIFQLIHITINLFLFLILIRVILSWVSPGGYNPAAAVIYQLTEPLLGRVRRLLPASSGLDFSPFIAGLGLWFIGRLISVYLYPLINYL